MPVVARPVAALIDTPNLFSVVVAVLAGIVGVVSPVLLVVVGAAGLAAQRRIWTSRVSGRDAPSGR